MTVSNYIKSLSPTYVKHPTLDGRCLKHLSARLEEEKDSNHNCLIPTHQAKEGNKNHLTWKFADYLHIPLKRKWRQKPTEELNESSDGLVLWEFLGFPSVSRFHIAAVGDLSDK